MEISSEKKIINFSSSNSIKINNFEELWGELSKKFTWSPAAPKHEAKSFKWLICNSQVSCHTIPQKLSTHLKRKNEKPKLKYFSKCLGK